MYEPTWSDDKVISAVCEGAAVVLAAIGVAVTQSAPLSSRPSPR